MTKEQVLDKHSTELTDGNKYCSHTSRLKAMNEWAAIQCKAFAEWINKEGWQQYDGYDRWICPNDNRDVLTTGQLYEKWKSTTA